MMLSTMIGTTTPSQPTTIDVREDINIILREWHFGTEEMFDNEDLECMADDIIKVINKKYQLPLKKNNQEIN